VGREGVFSQYTKHDISHIEEMLRILDWLVLDSTKTLMTPADWLLTVMSIYMHDIGMVVTAEEYEQRDNSAFPEFKQMLFEGPDGADYKGKVGELAQDDAERFLYQEFVRDNHATRSKAWILGNSPAYLGAAEATAAAIGDLLSGATPEFRRDLALVCESHHLDDLGEFDKYKVSQPYGNTAPETANVHYAALLLRSADLLHMTRDRTPSILFRLINPSDPSVSKNGLGKRLCDRSEVKWRSVGKARRIPMRRVTRLRSSLSLLIPVASSG
jgi:hypothetical protein